MCGLAGIIDIKKKIHNPKELLFSMGRRIAHRGPDEEGIWFDKKTGVGLSHRRLSILDLSTAGSQPMHSHSDRYVMVFNGEIYSHLRIRHELEKYGGAITWRGHSDSETLLAGFEAWGIENTISRCEGMFAIAVFDKQERRLILVRDRLGEKPLYYGIWNQMFLFASELKSLGAVPGFQPILNREAVKKYFKYSYVPAPHSIYEGVYKLQPGFFLSLPLVDNPDLSYETNAYWSYPDLIKKPKYFTVTNSKTEAVSQLQELLQSSVSDQMISDVPIGAFLSGGIDSSLVVSIMQGISEKKIKTFTIGFLNDQNNESEYARAISDYLGTEHFELILGKNELIDTIPLMGEVFDEPFGDSSQVPTYLVSKLTRNYVTVALSGDGGDELFSGYDRYWASKGLWNRYKKIPSWLIRAIPPIQDYFPALLANSKARQIQRLARISKSDLKKFSDFYQHVIIGHDHGPNFLNPEIGRLSSQDINPLLKELKLANYSQLMMNIDVLSYLPDDILAKVDRAAMASSLETRVPFLNYRIVEFASGLPLEYKQEGTKGKVLLKELLSEYLPVHLYERPKQGFGLPFGVWLRGPLKFWADDLIFSADSIAPNIFIPASIESIWRSYLLGNNKLQSSLWDILMFLSWSKQMKEYF